MRRTLPLLFALSLMSAAACTTTEDECLGGSEGCECVDNRCFGELTCLSNRCVSTTGETTGQTMPDASTGTDGSETTLPPGMMVNCPAAVAAASGHELYTGDAGTPRTIDLTFTATGSLDTIAGVACEVDTDGMPMGGICADVYECGGCVVNAVIGEEMKLDFYTEDGQGGACDAFDGWFRLGICEPACDAGETCDGVTGNCVDGSNSPCTTNAQCPFEEYCATGIGKCRTDPCDACIAECNSLPAVSCCTCGDGCYCKSQCFNLCLP